MRRRAALMTWMTLGWAACGGDLAREMGKKDGATGQAGMPGSSMGNPNEGRDAGTADAASGAGGKSTDGGAGTGGSAGGGGNGGSGGSEPTSGQCMGAGMGAWMENATAQAKYVISAVQLPMDAAQAKDLGCDLNDDQRSDNQLGTILVTLASNGANPQQSFSDSIQRGGFIELLYLLSDVDLLTSAAKILVASGCHNYSKFDPAVALFGMGEFERSDLPFTFAGAIEGGVGTFGPGTLELPLSLFGSARIEVNLIGAHVNDVVIAPDRLMKGKICGAVPEMDVEDRIKPGLAVAFSEAVALGGASAQQICDLFDTDASCSPSGMCKDLSATNPPPSGCISADEIKSNPLVSALLSPDVVIGGVKALSLGIGFEAVGAQF